MEPRPKILIEFSVADKILEVLCYVVLSAIWILVIMNYSSLPDTIPTHYNGMGKADDFGSKISILILPIVATVLFSAMTILNKFPHVFNYTTNIEDGNARTHYTNATRIIRQLKLAVVIIFALIVFKTIQTATEKSDVLDVLFLPLTLALIFIPLSFYVIKYCTAKKQMTDKTLS
jgi:uncharacterized membrane protein